MRDIGFGNTISGMSWAEVEVDTEDDVVVIGLPAALPSALPSLLALYDAMRCANASPTWDSSICAWDDGKVALLACFEINSGVSDRDRSRASDVPPLSAAVAVDGVLSTARFSSKRGGPPSSITAV